MVRILMNIQHFSPFLRTVSGEIVVEHIDYRNTKSDEQVKEVMKCSFDYKPGQVGFKSFEGFGSAIFNGIKPQLDVMIHSYVAGMTLAPHDFSWLEDSVDKPLDEWLKEKETEYENSDEYKLGQGKKLQFDAKNQIAHKQ